ncbi:MAG: TolC family outer membrane protein [Rhodoferax sp.]|nr:TolC family outer membrane protein [Rhodoferax sp.]
MLSLSCGAQSLTEVCSTAQAQDAQFASARAAYHASLEKLPQARAGVLPTVALTANQNRQAGEASFSGAPFIERSPTSWSWSLQLTQPLFRYGNWVAYRQADAQLAQAEAQFSGAKQDLLLRCAQSYFDVVLARENVAVMDAQLASTKEQLTLAQRNFEVGTGTVTDVHEVRAKQAFSQAQRISAWNELLGKQAELERMLGSAKTVPAVRIVGMLPTLDAASMEEWRINAGARNPQVKSQEAALEVAKREVSKSRSMHMPSLDLTIGRSTNSSDGTLSSPADLSTRVNASQIGLQLNVPLFAGGGSQSRVRESLAQLEKAEADLANAKRAAETLARQAFWGVISGEAQTAALLQAVAAGVSAVEGNKIGFRVGTRINPDVLNAAQQLFSAQRDLSKSRVETLIQSLKLKAAAGALQEQDIVAIELLLEPTK